MSSRKLKDWLTAYLKYTENTEPPKSYHTWTALAVMAGALQRKCYTVWGHDTIYPNLYTVLIGESGRCRKGTAMKIGRDIFMDIDLPLVSESITKQALIRDLADSNQSFQDKDGTIKFHCSLMCMSAELSVFLGQKDVAFLADLTDWYDAQDDWKYKTKGGGTDHIQGVCFNLLGACAPSWLPSILPDEAVGGGFTSRIIFVVEENKAKIVPLHDVTEEEKSLREDLVHDLRKISLLTGKYHYSEEARQWYKDWYVRTEKDMAKGMKAIDDPRMAGYCDRRATHIRKLAMIFSASRSDELEVEIQDFERALNVMQAAEVKMHKAFGGLGKSQYAQIVEMVLDYLMLRGSVKRSDLLKAFYRDLDPNSLQVAEQVLTGMKVVRVDRISDGDNSDVKYTYIGPR